MDWYTLDSNRSRGHDFSKLSEFSARERGSFSASSRGGLSSSSSISNSLVLDTQMGGLVEENAAKSGKKTASEAKTIPALKNHSEAEKRRRERINGHLNTLRGIVPCREKMDKAALLAEVISQVKELKKKAIEASKGMFIPMDADEVRVEPYNGGTGDEKRPYFKASLCCDYGPELLSDLRQALDALPLNIVKAEISTLGCRVRNVFLFTGCKEGEANDAVACQQLSSSVLQALSSVLKKGSDGLADFSPRTTLQNKRSKVSFFDSSSSSS